MKGDTVRLLRRPQNVLWEWLLVIALLAAVFIAFSAVGGDDTICKGAGYDRECLPKAVWESMGVEP